MRRAWRVVKRTAVSFYDDQMTHHAAALTYYSLMSLFPVLLLGISLLGLLGDYPGTYNAIIRHLHGVVPDNTLDALDRSLRDALRHKGSATTGLVIGVVTALYGSTGVLEAARRAMNVAFDVERGRSFLRRKSVDLMSSVVLGALMLMTILFVFVGGSFADRVFAILGLGSGARTVWSALRWPAAVVAAILAFSWVYYVTPDVHHRGRRWITPGAVVGVALWLTVSYLFRSYLSHFPHVSAVYGAFAAAIVLVVWLWLSSVALLLGAELDAEIEREKELAEGVPPERTIDRQARTG